MSAVRNSSILPSQGQLDFYEAPTFSLTPTAQRQLAYLAQKHLTKKFEEALDSAQKNLTESAGDINDRLTRKDRQVKRIQNGSTNFGSDTQRDSERSLEEMRNKVQKMTQSMDKNLRKLIDTQHDLQSLVTSIQEAAEDARLNAHTQASTQRARTQRSRRSQAANGSDDDDDHDDDDAPRSFNPTDPAGAADPGRPPIEVFRERFDQATTRYQSHSLVARYGEDNTYRDFKRLVHDALYPDDDVQLPHHSEWFQEGSVPAPGVRLAGATAGNDDDEDDDDDDIAVSRATISTKCPITLRELKDPLTSKKCPHSFESSAILSMIGQSNTRVPAPSNHRSNTERAVQCPVLGCSQLLSKHDLHADPVLLRKIKRIQNARQMQEDEEDDEDGSIVPGSQRRTHILDDEDEDDSADIDDLLLAPEATDPKNEPRGTGAMRDGDEENEDEDEDVVMMSD